MPTSCNIAKHGVQTNATCWVCLHSISIGCLIWSEKNSLPEIHFIGTLKMKITISTSVEIDVTTQQCCTRGFQNSLAMYSEAIPFKTTAPSNAFGYSR